MNALDELQGRALVASGEDRQEWLRARKTGVTATQAGKLAFGSASDREAIRAEKAADFEPREIVGNRYIDRGNEREPKILAWVKAMYGFEASDVLFHGLCREHLATPDGLGLDDERLVTVEVKTSKYNLDPSIPDGHFWTTPYFAQVQWQMHVTGAEACLFVWEQHDDDWENGPSPVDLEPRTYWFYRDDSYIQKLVDAANEFWASLDDEGESFDGGALEALIAEYGELDARVAELTGERDAVKARIREFIGDVPSFAASTSAGKVALSTSKPSPRFDEKLWAEKAPKAYEKFLEAKKKYVSVPEARVSLRVTPKRD